MLKVMTPIKVSAKDTIPIGTRGLRDELEGHLDADTVAKLIACGALVDLDAAAPDEAPEPDASPLAQAIVAMLAEDPQKANDSWWTTDGKPEVKALAARTEGKVSAKDRDAAWDLHVAGQGNT